MTSYPAWICSDCGEKYGRILSEHHCATFHVGDACGWCLRADTAVTEPRDYGYPEGGAFWLSATHWIALSTFRWHDFERRYAVERFDP